MCCTRRLALRRRSGRPRCRGPAPSTASARACCASTPARIGLAESFTIHDRGDAEDLMGLVRQELGLVADETALSAEGHLPGASIRASSTAGPPLRRGAARTLPVVQRWEAELKRLFRAYVERKQQQHVLDYDDLLLYWSQMMAEPGIARACRRALRPCAGRRIPGHQPAAGGDPARAEARRPRRHGGRRRRAVDLLAFAPPRCATSSTFRAASSRRRAWSRSSATTARRSRSSTHRTPSSRWPASASRSACGASARRR